MGFQTPRAPVYYDSEEEEEFTPQEDTEDSKAVLAQLLGGGNNKQKPKQKAVEEPKVSDLEMRAYKQALMDGMPMDENSEELMLMLQEQGLI